MKIVYSILLSLITLLTFSLQAFTQLWIAKEKFKEYKIVLNGVNFTVDPQIELFHTIEVLQGISLVNPIELD